MKIIRYLFLFAWGVSLGLLLQIVFLKKLELPIVLQISFMSIICVIFGIGCAQFVEFRCISLLVLPSMFTKLGRSFIRAMILVFLLEGPVKNTISNTKELVRLITCGVSLNYNLTKVKLDVYFEPFINASKKIHPDYNEINSAISSLNYLVAPIKTEIEDDYPNNKSTTIDNKYKISDDDSENMKTEKSYLNKMEHKCNNQLDKAMEKCKDVFSDKYTKCLETALLEVVGWMFCWPLQLEIVCNIADSIGVSSVCDSSMHISPGVGDNYGNLTKDVGEFKDNFTKADINHVMQNVTPNIEIHGVGNISDVLIKKIVEKVTVIDYLLKVIHLYCTLLFLKIITSSQSYHDEFVKNIYFDNKYITAYFRAIDKKRKDDGKASLLPLKRMEKSDLIDVYSDLIKCDSGTVLQFGKLILEIAIVLIILLFDMLIYESMRTIRNHARVDYDQTGLHDLIVEVKGTGMLSALVKSLIKEFNVKKRVHLLSDNVDCLPSPFQLQRIYYCKIFGGYLMVAVIILFDVSSMRLRRLICAYYYKTIEKKRILFIYNKALKKRHNLQVFIKRKMKFLSKDYVNFRSIFGISSIIQCMLCGVKYYFPNKKKSNTYVCKNGNCKFTYCFECWKEAGMRCFACRNNRFEDSSDDAFFK